jgi:hypothetical protein
MHVFPATFEIDGYPVSLLIVQFAQELSIETMLEAIYNDFPSERQQANALVIRPDVRDQFSGAALIEACSQKSDGSSSFLDSVAMAMAAPRQALGRFQNLPVYVLHCDNFEPVLSDNINPLARGVELLKLHSDVTGALCDAEMRFLVQRSRAHLPPVEGAYYLPPSNKAARSFLRVGNIQYSRQAIDAVTFWLLPFLSDSRAILVDTWSLSSIALNASRVLATLRNEPPIPVEMLSQYQDADEGHQPSMLEIFDRLVHEALPSYPEYDPAKEDQATISVTCLISATQSGSLVNALDTQRELSGLDVELTFVALYRLGKTGGLPALCDMSDDADFALLDDSEKGDGSPIVVDPQAYFPLRYKDVELTPLAVNALPFKPFLDLVKGQSVLSVHRDQITDGPTRHHGIHVDTERLFALPDFCKQFEILLLGLDPVPSVVLTPLHSAAGLLGEMAVALLEKATGTKPLIIRHTSLEFREDGPTAEYDANVRAQLSSVPAESSILILDDCYITGARMTGYQTRLRQIEMPARLHYIVGVARPASDANWDLFKRRLSFRAKEDRKHHHSNSINAVCAISLPNWQEQDCPWCREASLYADFSMKVREDTLPVLIEKRSSLLDDRDTGLTDNLFLVADGVPALRLYSGSVFAPQDCNQAEVYASAAAALQHLRETSGEKPKLGRRRYPIATVIEAKNYLRVMYTDSILRASILRSAVLEELVYTDREQEQNRTSLMMDIIHSGHADQNDLAAELILAHAMRKCSLAEVKPTANLPADLASLLHHARNATRPR